MIFSKILIFVFLLFWAVILVPELFRKLRETHRKSSHQVWSKSDWFCTSYEEKKLTFLQNIAKTYSLRFSSFFTSNCQNWAFSTGKSNSWRPTVYFPSWNGLESWMLVKTPETCVLTCFSFNSIMGLLLLLLLLLLVPLLVLLLSSQGST